MWKFLLLSSLWIQWVQGQCGSYTFCSANNNFIRSASISQFHPRLAEQSNVNPNSRTPINQKQFTGTTNLFYSKLFNVMFVSAQHQNVVYSPISLQVLLSFIYTLSNGKLFEELERILEVPNDRMYVINSITNLLSSPSFNTAPTTIVMANKLYYDNRFGRLNDNVKSLAFKVFDSQLEPIDFLDPHKAAYFINSWISNKTHHLIRDVIIPWTISPYTNAVILNSLYFKSEWLHKFSIHDTKLERFYINRQSHVLVEIMSNVDTFRYGEFRDLQASVLEIPYKTSDLTMMLILPQNIEGLLELEYKLTHNSWNMLSQHLRMEVVYVKLPKFKIEYDIDMMKPLQKLGLNALFSMEGNINIFKDHHRPLSVNQVKHKTYIRVNEDGTEAASSTFGKLIPYSLNHNMKHFVADHPFVFVIRSSDITFFVGHVVRF